MHLWDLQMDLLPWPSNLLPHPWCENTVSHHGVKAAAPFLFRSSRFKPNPRPILLPPALSLFHTRTPPLPPKHITRLVVSHNLLAKLFTLSCRPYLHKSKVKSLIHSWQSNFLFHIFGTKKKKKILKTKRLRVKLKLQ